MADIIKKQGVREHSGGANIGSGVYEALDERVKELLSDAVDRADGNGRKTVKARDV